MTCPERKSVEPIALLVGHGDASGLQKFLGVGPWPYDDVQAEAQALFADELAPSAIGSPVGTVGVVDESAFSKKGAHSAGVARQHNGRLGKQDNCQVGVFLVGVTPAGSALLDHQLFLPESWCEPTRQAKDRRARAHIPEGLAFRTKPRIAAELVRAVAVLGQVALDGVVADEEYGRAGHFLDELEALEQRYVVEVPVTTAVWTADPATCIPASSGRGRVPTAPARDAVRTVAALAAELPASAWQTRQVRGGAGVGDAPPQAGADGLVADPPLTGRTAGGEVLRLERRRRDPAVDAGACGLHALPGGGVLRGRQELPRHGAVRDAVVGRMAPPHGAGGAGAPVRDAGAEAAPKKVAGADTGPHGAAAAGGAGGAGVEAAPGDGAGGLSRASEQGSQEVAHQEMAGQTPGRQIPATVELVAGLPRHHRISGSLP